MKQTASGVQDQDARPRVRDKGVARNDYDMYRLAWANGLPSLLSYMRIPSSLALLPQLLLLLLLLPQLPPPQLPLLVVVVRGMYYCVDGGVCSILRRRNSRNKHEYVHRAHSVRTVRASRTMRPVFLY